MLFHHLGHGRNVNLGNSPDLAAIAAGKTRVGGALAGGDSVAKAGVGLVEGDDGVLVGLGSDRAGAATIALGTSTVSSLSMRSKSVQGLP